MKELLLSYITGQLYACYKVVVFDFLLTAEWKNMFFG